MLLNQTKSGYRSTGISGIVREHIIETKIVDSLVFVVCQVSRDISYFLVDFNFSGIICLDDIFFKKNKGYFANRGKPSIPGIRFFSEDGLALEYPVINDFVVDNVRSKIENIPGVHYHKDIFQHFGGIIGLKICQSTQVEIDYPNQKLSFHPVNKRQTGVPIQMTVIDEKICIVCKTGQVSSLWNINCVSEKSGFIENILKINPQAPYYDIFIAEKESLKKIKVGNMTAQLELGGKITTIPIQIAVPLIGSRISAQQYKGLIGSDVLKFFSITFDLFRKEIVIKY